MPRPIPYAAMLLAAALTSAPAAAAERQEVSFDLVGVEVLGDGPDRVKGGLGAFDVIDDDDLATLAGVEYRFGQKLFFLGPAVGILGNGDGAVFGYGALHADLRFDRWVVSPVAGLGGYDEDDSKDLGGVFQLYLGLDVAYRLPGGSRLGVNFSHISNADVHERNPGTEMVFVTLTVPLEMNVLSF